MKVGNDVFSYSSSRIEERHPIRFDFNCSYPRTLIQMELLNRRVQGLVTSLLRFTEGLLGDFLLRSNSTGVIRLGLFASELHFPVLGLHSAPLGARIVNIEASKNGYDNSCYSCNERAFLVNPVNDYDRGPSNCFQHPHRVLGVMPLLFGLFLFTAGWGGVGRIWIGPDLLQVGFGLIVIITGLWCVYHGFGLIEFEVYPWRVGHLNGEV